MGAEELPEPPIAADVDLKDFAFTPLYRARLFGSSFHAHSNDSEWRAGLTLWLRSQEQTPAGSLPDDDVELCRLAELGRDIKAWRKVRAGALHGWYRCRDGRLYHKVVAEVTNEQWVGKLRQRWVTACSTLRKYCQRRKIDYAPSGFEEWMSLGCPTGQAMIVLGTQDGTSQPLSHESPHQETVKGQGREETGNKDSDAIASDACATANGYLSNGKSARGTRLPDDWRPSGEACRFAESLGLDPGWATDEFRDYWHGVPGAKGLKANWDATFRNRCRELASNPRFGSRGGVAKPGGVAAAADRVIARLDDGGW